MGIESVSAFRGTFGLGATGSVYASPPTSYFRANADAIVLTNRKIGALRLPQSGFVQGRFGSVYESPTFRQLGHVKEFIVSAARTDRVSPLEIRSLVLRQRDPRHTAECSILCATPPWD